MKRIFLLLGLAFSLSFVLIVCGGSDDEETTRNYLGTQAPGDVWSWTITTSGGTGTFSATNETLTFTYSGTVETMSNRFLRLTVTSTTDPGCTTPAVAYALEYPNTALIVKPAGDDSDVIVAVALGSCPAENETYNWVEILDKDWDNTQGAYGVTTSEVSGSDFTFTHEKYLLNGSSDGSPVTESGFTCSDGEITNPANPGVIAITASGVFIGDNGPSAGGIVGMSAPASNIAISDVVLDGREYRGIIFEDSTEDDDEDTKPIWVRPNGTGGLIGGDYEDFEAGTESLDPATITFSTQNSPGIVNATLTDSSPTPRPMIFMINKINSKYFLYGAYQTEDGDGGNFIVIEQ